MPIKHAEVITKDRDVQVLFLARTEINEEIQRRAWVVLRALGYDWYRQTSMTVAYSMRGKVTIVSINARFEHNHQHEQADHEVPLEMFNALNNV